ncbi:pitrilysin family protein [Candidatus Nitronereus thalassa]|uniref:Pitrilysin family protein n=1 Tax=Candidatus Nitronereus thalassa TaxID=3020898 RepID=A0ABU3K4Z5_9BACT|nr:pitrilysin family protein [Candidatus Nitronereus thalassa]MDT7041443.1 pitrilysin family protein [Candidatus Nitronereus thalassa]
MKKRQSHILGLVLVTVALLAAPAWAQVERVEQLNYPPLPEIKIPTPTRVVLDNGLVVLLLEDHELPIVSLSARIRTGARLEPKEKIGLAGLTGTVMRSGGTKTRPGDELDDYLEGKAASIETAINTTAGTASMNCLIEDFEEVLQVFVDVLRNPSFAEDKLAIAKNQLMAGIARQNDNPDGIVRREFAKLIYGKDSPYATQETYATVGGITREDLLNWHQQYYHPNRMILGLVGDFKTSEALNLVKQVFGQWPKGPEFTAPEVPYQTTIEPGVYYVEKNDMTQAKIIMGHMGLIRMHPDYHSVVITNQILSGSFGARLFSNIRSKKGLAYDVHGGVGFGWDYPASANFSMSTKTETTQAGIEALIKEAHKIRKTEPPTEEEVRNAKASLLNSFVFSVDSPSKVMGKLLTYEYYDYPADWMTRFRNGIERVTTEQVRRATQQHIKPEQFVILVVGPRQGTAPALASYDKVQELDISIPES